MNSSPATRSGTRVGRFARALLGGLCLCTLAPSALAAPFDIAKLPTGSGLQQPPNDPPHLLSKRSRYSGVFQSQLLEGYRGSSYTGASFFQSADAADSASTSGLNLPILRRSGEACFTLSPAGYLSEASAPRVWDSTSERYAQVVRYDGYRRMVAVRYETLTVHEADATLDVHEFWVDTISGGSKEYRSSSLALKRVADEFAGVTVFAARTGPQSVEIVLQQRPTAEQERVTSALSPQEFEGLLNSGFNEAIVTTRSENAGRSTCGHARFNLTLDNAAPAPVAAETSSRFVGLAKVVQNEAFALDANVRTGTANALVTPVVKWEPGEPSDPSRGLMYTRALTFNFGLSRSSSDKSALLSVSHRWAPEITKQSLVVHTPEEGGFLEMIDVSG